MGGALWLLGVLGSSGLASEHQFILGSTSASGLENPQGMAAVVTGMLSFENVVTPAAVDAVAKAANTWNAARHDNDSLQ